MKFGFTDWRLLDQSPVDLDLDKNYIYYLHARAWALKGWIGGTHSYTTFWSKKHSEWLVIELTDKETLEVQQADTYYIWDHVDYTEHSPAISNRDPKARWFGARPFVVGQARNLFLYEDFENAAREYPIKKFELLKQNCNTFTSYLISRLGLRWSRPLRSVGFRNRKFWNEISK